MPKIGKIRFVNFTYNDNRHIYDQTFDFYNGEDTLLNLQNGGGKTVLVQMMMQPVIPKLKLKDRAFQSYFMNAKAPAYIMIEWILDGRPERAMTGIGIKRVLGKNIEDETGSIKVVTFLSEYEGESPYDIRNIQLTEDEKGIIKLIDFDRVIKKLSDAQKEGQPVSVFRWNSSEDKREYARRLSEYTINQAEWKNLMVKINEAEAGLNSFFNDCKTNKALIKKWFIPTIEDQLNNNGNLIETIKELIRNHAIQLVQNEDMIAEQEIFEAFKRESADTISTLADYADLLSKADEYNSSLGNACAFTMKSLKRLGYEKEETENVLKQTEEQIRLLEYQRLSSEYYTVQDSLDEATKKASGISEELEVVHADLTQLETKRNLLLCLKIRDELANLNTRIATFESELEKESLQQEDIRHVIHDLRYSLKEKYHEKLCKLEALLADEKINVTEETNQLSSSQEEYNQIQKEISEQNDKMIHIRGRISAFDERKASIESMYADFNLAKNMDTGEYGQDSLEDLKHKLDAEESELTQKIYTIEEKRKQNADKLSSLEIECTEFRHALPTLAIEKDKKESACQAFQKNKDEIIKILNAYQIEESLLYDREKVILTLRTDKEKYQKLINDLHVENAGYHKRLKQYETGNAFELSDEIKHILDENHIFVEYGHDWLRDRPEHKKEKQRMVRNNPFLPYALIVAEKDLELIKELEFKGVLSPVIPIVERKKLEQAVADKSGKDVYDIEGIHFLIPFDDRVLNKNYVKEICDELTYNSSKNNEVIKNAEDALNHLTVNIMKVENFPYTKQDAEMLPNEMDMVSKKLDACKLRLANTEKEVLELKQADKDNFAVQNDLKRKMDRFLRKQEDLLGFINRCRQYSLDLQDKRVTEDQFNKAAALLALTETKIAKSKSSIQDSNLQISTLSSALDNDRQQYQKYADASSGTLLKDSIEHLESKLAAYTSEANGKIQNLQDILADYRHRRDDKQKEMDSYSISEDMLIGKQYHVSYQDAIEEEIEQKKHHFDQLAETKNEIQFTIAERKSDLKYKSSNIKEHCGYDEPLQRESIKDLDFQKEKKLLKDALKLSEKKIVQIRKQDHDLQKIWFVLEEYSDYADQITDVKMIKGNLGDYVSGLIKGSKNSIVLISDMKNTLDKQYNALEGEFVPKAELFKSLFHAILNGDKKYQPTHALHAFQRVYNQIDRRLEQHSIDMKKIDDMERYIIDNTLSYLKQVYDEMAHIDRNSTIDLDGRRCKMLMISLPEYDALENISLKEYLKSTIYHCVELHKHKKSMDGLLDSEISTYNLFDRFVSINKIEITLMKIEPNRLKKKTWKQVIAENSGGELFVSAFVVFISLLTYMRGNSMLNTGMDGKVLIMDNPFGPITSEHLLKPLFEISKKYNTQLICLTDVKGHAIYDRFNLIYTLNIEREVGKEDEYIELRTVKKEIETEEDEFISASLFKIENKSRFELVN